MEENNSQAIVLHSGGQDSTTCLFKAIHEGYSVIAISFLYGQRHLEEVKAARDICAYARKNLKVEVEHFILYADVFHSIADSALVTEKEDINAAHRSRDDLPASFVPGRNVIFLTLAAAYAYKRGVHDIFTGVCQTDYSGYPDCRQATISSLQETLCLALDYSVTIHTPLMYLSKADTVDLAKELPGCWGALALTHTCYEGQRPPCGVCPACKIRAEGFRKAGRTDPLTTRLR